MGAISTMLTAYRTLLAASPASLVNMPANLDSEDLPASTLHKTFKLYEAVGPALLSIHGTTSVEYEAEVGLEIHWDPFVDEEAVYNTVADDIENALHVMLKTSNRTSGVLTVQPSQRFAITEVSPNDIRAVGTFSVRFRVTQDMS